MARMYPRTLLEDEVESAGEKRVFEALRDGLPDDWEVFHSVSWMMRDPAEGANDGEIDFVLCHPEQGILCLEVKGGGHRVPARRVVPARATGSASGSRIRSQQALDHRYALERKLDDARTGAEPRTLHRPRRRLPGHHRPQARPRARRAARDPDRPQRPRRRSRTRSSACSPTTAARATSGSRPARRAPATLRDLLAPDVRIEVPMAAEFLEEEEALITLTHEQARCSSTASAATGGWSITGCAGSGKTMLAVEQAKRLAAEGRGRALRLLQPGAARSPARRARRGRASTFQTFHGLCIAARAAGRGRAARVPEGRGAARVLGRGAARRARRGDRRARAPVRRALRRRGPGPRQRLARRADAARSAIPTTGSSGSSWTTTSASTSRSSTCPTEFRPFDLTVNCRNTQAIHREVHEEVRGRDRARGARARGPRGRAASTTDDQAGDRRRGRSSASAARRRSRRRTSSSSPRTASRTPRSARPSCRRAYTFVKDAAAARPVHPLLVDPRLQGPRVAGGRSSASSRTSTTRRSTSSSTSGSRGRGTTA